jgi:hypothetical protein
MMRLAPQEFRPPGRVHAAIYSLPQAIAFVVRSQPGDSAIYHAGDLAADGCASPDVASRQRYMAAMASVDLVALRQYRVCSGWTHYVAMRSTTPRSHAPRGVVLGDVDAVDFLAVRAVRDRSTHDRAVTAISEATGIERTRAIAVQADLIARGLLTADSPPRLTAEGQKLLR